jgi:hypothetical protein
MWAMAGAALGVLIGLSCSGVSAQMTGPIDTGRVPTERLQLGPAPPAPAPPAARRTTGAAPAAPARTLDIRAFFGSFSGSGLADGEDTAYLGVTPRDLDVRIAATGENGFTVSWTTVLRVGGDAQNPEVRRRATSLTFRPGPRPGLFTALDNGDPLQGGMLSWARISRSTLTIHQFSVRDGGQHEIQTYARTLTGSGMDLVYTRVVDGERQRRVRGKLVKNAG